MNNHQIHILLKNQRDTLFEKVKNTVISKEYQRIIDQVKAKEMLVMGVPEEEYIQMLEEF